MTKHKGKLTGSLVNFIGVLALFAALVVLMESGAVNNYARGIIVQCLYIIIVATSLNLSSGFLGQLQLGHAGFMAVGAYTSAIIAKAMTNAGILVGAGAPAVAQFFIALFAGGLMAAIFGLLVGIPALRLRGDYLAIITLGFSEIIRVLIQNLKFAGGRGLAEGQAGQALIGIPVMNDVYIIFWIMVVCVAAMYTFVRSKYGRAIMAIREDDIASGTVGINNTYYKVLTFVMSAMFAGIAGAIFAHRGLGTLQPADFGLTKSVEFIVMVVLGGMGSLTGSIAAAIVLSLLPEALRTFSLYRMLVYSIVLIMVMIFRPIGLLGTYEFSLLGIIKRIFTKPGEQPKEEEESNE
jgi:branched-chain amino acid transport system permease protein